MPVSKTFSATLEGIDGVVVQLESSSQATTPQICVSGLAGEVVKESRERVRASLAGLGYDVPSSRILIHLSPAESRKQGSQLDLAIAVAVLLAEKLVPRAPAESCAFLGELTLDGRLRPVSAAANLADALTRRPELGAVILPEANAPDVDVLGDSRLRIARDLGQVIAFLRGEIELAKPATSATRPATPAGISLDRIRGQVLGKRAVQIAVAGRHHLLLMGAPGVGKSLLAHASQRLLPPLEPGEAVEIRKNYAYCPDEVPAGGSRPFRAPHHTISAQGLIGGGTSRILPGEVTLAHRGTLFLDECPELRRDLLEGLREPLEDGMVRLRRVGASRCLPARFLLLAAMNPCPCGYSLERERRCVCPPERIARYRQRLSGPLLDRIDLGVALHLPRSDEPATPGAETRAREAVARAWETQATRYLGTPSRLNADVTVPEGDSFELPSEAGDWLAREARRMGLSWRSLHKILRVSRTIADLEASPRICVSHVREAVLLRCGAHFLGQGPC